MNACLPGALLIFLLVGASATPETAEVAASIRATTVTISPEKLDFGSQPVGTTSQPKTATLANTGSSLLTIRDILPAGIDFAQTNTCQGGVAPSANCTIEVRFTPATTGPRLGTIMITDTDPGSPHMLMLSGTGQ